MSSGNPRSSPTAEPAIDAILSAFETHALVGIGDYHGLAQQAAFYADLVSDPRFARDVRNVVVEFGGAAAQPIVDRFVAGEAVPYPELRRVWTDVVGWLPTVWSLSFMWFYAAVRAANLKLPPEQQIRVWLGEPPIDWSAIHTREDLYPLVETRDSHPAELIKQQILNKGEKAVVIYGSAHFQRAGFYVPQNDMYVPTLLGLIEQDYPESLFLVVPYTGFTNKACIEKFEALCGDWPTPALVGPVKGTLLHDMLVDPEFKTFDQEPPGNEKLAEMQRCIMHTLNGATADALLYLGPAMGLTLSAIDPQVYLDLDFLAEINRRFELYMPEQSFSYGDVIKDGTPLPQFIRPR
ncbi:hypothetical protein FS800_12005 [Agrobacterium vitis]|uniref:hypothetical protein n=1 Tax=Allorhizobium ampelinum TaxID=3025782 RepID=UPI001F2C4906|nr:hypothetical protein [Allorhizobium ampelinum]MCF1482885.1 hypothetical protein [Allorhizobium ampelinum]